MEGTKPLPIGEIDSEGTGKHPLNGNIISINYKGKSLQKVQHKE